MSVGGGRPRPAPLEAPGPGVPVPGGPAASGAPAGLRAAEPGPGLGCARYPSGRGPPESGRTAARTVRTPLLGSTRRALVGAAAPCGRCPPADAADPPPRAGCTGTPRPWSRTVDRARRPRCHATPDRTCDRPCGRLRAAGLVDGRRPRPTHGTARRRSANRSPRTRRPPPPGRWPCAPTRLSTLRSSPALSAPALTAAVRHPAGLSVHHRPAVPGFMPGFSGIGDSGWLASGYRTTRGRLVGEPVRVRRGASGAVPGLGCPRRQIGHGHEPGGRRPGVVPPPLVTGGHRDPGRAGSDGLARVSRLRSDQGPATRTGPLPTPRTAREARSRARATGRRTRRRAPRPPPRACAPGAPHRCSSCRRAPGPARRGPAPARPVQAGRPLGGAAPASRRFRRRSGRRDPPRSEDQRSRLRRGSVRNPQVALWAALAARRACPAGGRRGEARTQAAPRSWSRRSAAIAARTALERGVQPARRLVQLTEHGRHADSSSGTSRRRRPGRGLQRGQHVVRAAARGADRRDTGDREAQPGQLAARARRGEEPVRRGTASPRASPSGPRSTSAAIHSAVSAAAR